MLVTYNFIQDKSDSLIEFKRESYNYENSNIKLQIKRNGRISIIKNLNTEKKS